MKQVPVDTVPVNTKFTYNNAEYIKENKVKISCCKFTNARLVSDPNQKVGLTPKTIVEVED